MIDSLKRINRTKRPEDSIPLRVSVLVAVMIAAGAVAAQGAISLSTAVLVGLALPFAYWLSYVRRAKDNWALKVIIAFAAILALARFFAQAGAIGTIDEVRFPLADVFLWVQVLHGFDLPARKDLDFSLGSSLALMGIAGSLSQDPRFGLFVLAYFGAAGAALFFAHRSRLAEDALPMEVSIPETVRSGVRPHPRVGRGVVAAVASAAAVFLLIPQASGVRTFGLPFQLGSGGGLAAPGGSGIANPGFLSGAPAARSGGSLYYALGAEMDLSVRGDLPDDLVMRVRASQPAMWRGLIFDTYDGRAWSSPTDEPELLGVAPPFYMPVRLRELGPRATVTQTFYVISEQPNVIFSASQPEVVWFYDRVFANELGSLTTDETITEGSAYSVVSSRGAASEKELRSLPEEETPDELQKYLQVPDDLPGRVGELARAITAGASNRHDKVKAIERYLARNYRYSTRSPVPEPGRDAVDHFLFDTDVGFCEQFASATAIMLRALDIPARVVTGYTPGSRNPFTGYLEVRASDAHAWVEVWYPRFGWYEYDPTFDIPPASESLASSVPLVQVMSFVGERLGSLLPGRAGGAGRWALVAALIAVVVWGAAMARRRFPRRRRHAPAVAPSGDVAAALWRLEEALASLGVPRKRAETARELIARAGVQARRPRGLATRTFERERYGPEPPPPEDVRRAVQELDGLTAATVAGVRTPVGSGPDDGAPGHE